MRRSSSTDRASLGPLRIRNDENRPDQSRKGRSSSIGKGLQTGGRSLSGNRMSMGVRHSISNGRPSMSGARKSMSHIPKFSQQRLSRGTGVGKGNGVPKDPRPVSEKSYQQKCVKSLQEFLTMRGYPHNITPKMLQSPTSKDFYRIFEFVYGFIAPKFKLSQKPEEEFPRMLKVLGYPFLISKTSMYAIGSPHTWPHILAALNFLIEFINYGMSVENHLEDMMFPPDDDGFDKSCISETQILYDYFMSTYSSFMDGNDEYDDENNHLKKTLRQKFLGVSGIEALIDENTALEQQLELLEQDPDRLKSAKQKIELLLHDEERLGIYIQELESHKRQQEQQGIEMNDGLSNLAIELEAQNSKVSQMMKIYENQEFTPADVERINMRQQELLRKKRELEQSCHAVDEDIWKEEIALSKEVELIESKCMAYNNLAHSMKLIPITAENSSGIDYELKKSTYADGSLSTFQNIIKPALLTMKSQCAESVSRQESEKIKVMEKLEQATDIVSDLKNDILLLESKLKRMEDEIESKKQMNQKELQHMQESTEELQNEMVNLNSVMFFSQQESMNERRRLESSWKQEYEKCDKKVNQQINFCHEALKAIMEHTENMRAHAVQALEYSEQLKKNR